MSRVRQCIPVSGVAKNELANGVSCRVEEYIAENPSADYDALCAGLGAPEEIAAAYMCGMSSDELVRKVSFRKSVVGIAASLAAIALVVWFGVVAWAAHAEADKTELYIEVAVEEVAEHIDVTDGQATANVNNE